MRHGMGTDLYYDYSERKDVRFPRDRTASLQNFWRQPCGGVPIFPCCRAHSANNRSRVEVGQTSMAVVTNENSGLAKSYRRGPN